MPRESSTAGAGELAVPIDVDALPQVRGELARSLRAAGAPESLVHDAEAVASELMMNALLHGSPDASGQVWLRWSTDAGTAGVTIEVEDGGSGTVPAVQDPGVTEGGGRGLRLVEELSVRWDVRRSAGSTTVTAELVP